MNARRQAPPGDSGRGFRFVRTSGFRELQLDRLFAFAALRPLAAGFIIGHNEIDVAYPERAASSNSVTTVGLRRPLSRSLIYCWVEPEASAKLSCVKPLAFLNRPKLRPTSLRISICASCVFTYYEVCLL